MEKYDYNRITLNFSSDDAEQMRVYEYLSALSRKKTEFLSEIVREYLVLHRIESKEDFEKAYKMFAKGQSFVPATAETSNNAVSEDKIKRLIREVLDERTSETSGVTVKPKPITEEAKEVTEKKSEVKKKETVKPKPIKESKPVEAPASVTIDDDDDEEMDEALRKQILSSLTL